MYLLRRFHIDTLVPIIFGILYLALPTKMYYIDGVYYAEHLENMPWHLNAFHPHHLLYLPISHFFYGIIHSIAPSIRAMTFLQATNAIFGAASIWLFSKMLKRIGFSVTSRLLAMPILGSSYTFWHHATDANIYIPAHFLSLILIYLVLTERFKSSIGFLILTGFVLAMAGLIHQITLLLAIPLGIYIVRSDKETGWARLIGMLMPALFVLIVTYLSVFTIYHGDIPATPENFARWVTAFGRGGHYFTISGKHTGKPLESIARGHAHAFFPLKSLERILFDQKSGDTKTQIRAYIYFLFLTFITVFIFILLLFKVKNPNYGLMFLVIFLLYFLLTSIFMPENHFYRIFYIPSLIIICGMMISSLPQVYKNILKPILGLIITIFFLNNLSHGIIPESKAVNNPYLVHTQLIDLFATPDDVVIFAPRDRYFTGIYRYFGKGDALHLQTGRHFLGYDDMMSEIDRYERETIEMLKNRYRRIYISQDALKTEIDPMIFTPNNYRLPHPKYMIVRRDNFAIARWRQAGKFYFAELKIVSSEQE